MKPLKRSKFAVGLDVGLNGLVMLSTGEHIHDSGRALGPAGRC